MPAWDSADLLARCKRYAGRPATDGFTADADWYALLTEAQVAEYQNFATHFPHILYGAPAALSTADGGLTYTFPSAVFPLGSVEIYETLSRPPLREGAYWDAGADYVFEGDKIRMPRGKAKTFSGGGPFARFITPPTVIDAATEPTLKPDAARILIVHRAVAYWAERGGFRDPSPFWRNWNRAWYGDPERGDLGFLTSLKTQSWQSGHAARLNVTGLTGLEFIDDGSGYTAYTP